MTPGTIEALVLKHVNFKDSDRIVTLFSREQGRVEGRARGVRRSTKRYQGRLDLFTRVNLTVGRRGSFDGAEVIDAYMGMRDDLERIAWAGAFAELTLSLFGQDEPHPRAYDILCLAMAHLDGPDDPRRGYLHILELSLLKEAGLMPEFLACVECGAPVGIEDDGRPRAFSFIASRGGTLCRRCQGSEALTPMGLGTLRSLERGLSMGPVGARRLRFTSDAEDEIARLIGGFLTYHVSGNFKARRFLEETWALP